MTVMRIDLSELKDTLPPDVLGSILERALRQVDADALQYSQAIAEARFAQAAQLIHSVRGLALFLGVEGSELDALQALEHELAAREETAAQQESERTALDERFQMFRIAFQTALREVGQRH